MSFNYFIDRLAWEVSTQFKYAKNLKEVHQILIDAVKNDYEWNYLYESTKEFMSNYYSIFEDSMPIEEFIKHMDKNIKDFEAFQVKYPEFEGLDTFDEIISIIEKKLKKESEEKNLPYNSDLFSRWEYNSPLMILDLYDREELLKALREAGEERSGRMERIRKEMMEYEGIENENDPRYLTMMSQVREIVDSME